MVDGSGIALRRSAGKLEAVLLAQPAAGTLRHRPHTLDHARASGRRERASAPRRQRAGCTVRTETDPAVDVRIVLPRLHPLLSPFAMTVLLPPLAYHAGVRRGCDVDQLCNLARSVTAE